MVSLHWHQLKRHDPNIPQSARSWSQIILKQFWKMVWQFWQARNDAVHNSSITQSDHYLRAEVTKKFNKAYISYLKETSTGVKNLV